MLRKMFFTKELCDKIKNDLLPETNPYVSFIKSFQFSDIRTILAQYDQSVPNFFEQIFPAVIVQPEYVEVVNASSNKTIVSQVYSFRIQYLHYRKRDNENLYSDDEELLKAIENCETLATILQQDDNLQNAPIGENPYFQLIDESGTLQAQLLETNITDLQYNRLGTSILNDMINGLMKNSTTQEKLHMCEFGYDVTIRTVYNKRRS